MEMEKQLRESVSSTLRNLKNHRAGFIKSCLRHTFESIGIVPPAAVGFKYKVASAAERVHEEV